MSTDSLPFSDRKQFALLGHLLTDNSFYTQCRGTIKPNWFSDPFCAKIWKAQLDLNESIKRIPTLMELKECREFFIEENKTKKAISDTFVRIALAAEGIGKDVLAPELTTWMKAVHYKEGIRKSQDLYNSERFEEAFSCFEGAGKALKGVSFEADGLVSFDDYDAIFQDDKLDRAMAISTGLTELDQLIDPTCTHGCLLPGDTTTLLGPSGTGKSTFLLNIALENVRSGKKVLYLLHEGNTRDIYKKVWMNMMNLDKQSVINIFDASHLHQEKIQKYATPLRNYFRFKPFFNPKLTVEQVIDYIYRLTERETSETGHGFDLIVCDYPSKLQTALNSRGNMVRRDKDDYVYNCFTQLAADLNVHCLDAIQSNREGAKINKGFKGSEKRLLTMEDVNEAYGPMQTATTVITLNRSTENEDDNVMIAHLCKSRSDKKGYSVIMRTDFAKAQTHSNALGCCFYFGTHTPQAAASELLKNFKGRSIPAAAMGMD